MDVALVLAGTSFVGRHVLDVLSGRGVAVRATCRASRPGFVRCDLTRPDEVDSLLQDVRPRWVFACAGATVESSPAALHALHVSATETLLEAASGTCPTP
jgi:nucleoside-diphosphate-sugar epimerase